MQSINIDEVIEVARKALAARKTTGRHQYEYAGENIEISSAGGSIYHLEIRIPGLVAPLPDSTEHQIQRRAFEEFGLGVQQATSSKVVDSRGLKTTRTEYRWKLLAYKR